jgi:hypothetical protein
VVEITESRRRGLHAIQVSKSSGLNKGSDDVRDVKSAGIYGGYYFEIPVRPQISIKDFHSFSLAILVSITNYAFHEQRKTGRPVV